MAAYILHISPAALQELQDLDRHISQRLEPLAKLPDLAAVA